MRLIAFRGVEILPLQDGKIVCFPTRFAGPKVVHNNSTQEAISQDISKAASMHSSTDTRIHSSSDRGIRRTPACEHSTKTPSQRQKRWQRGCGDGTSGTQPVAAVTARANPPARLTNMNVSTVQPGAVLSENERFPLPFPPFFLLVSNFSKNWKWEEEVNNSVTLTFTLSRWL